MGTIRLVAAPNMAKPNTANRLTIMDMITTTFMLDIATREWNTAVRCPMTILV